MLIALKRHLRLAISRSDPRPADPDPPATECHLAVLVAVTNSHAVRVVLAPRADDLLDLGLEQLAQDTQPDLDRQGEQSLSRRADELPQRLLHPLREHAFIL